MAGEARKGLRALPACVPRDRVATVFLQTLYFRVSRWEKTVRAGRELVWAPGRTTGSTQHTAAWVARSVGPSGHVKMSGKKFILLTELGQEIRRSVRAGKFQGT